MLGMVLEKLSSISSWNALLYFFRSGKWRGGGLHCEDSNPRFRLLNTLAKQALV